MSKPCVGCGWCCLTDPCMFSHRLYGYTKRCPAIHWDEEQNRYICKLMLDPEKGEEARSSQHEGQGCYAPLNSWRDDVRNRDND
ncbi:hypothetical protein [uncultured Pseudodesulfovibrio sp.]|uniref:hypothetical protein n=1 Tax=uncultured Pseudodesulfovibrio sp. TaxID=2035858 RepID=UPI0029C960F7|nr:hypothetical protein [uncultured Pseudodesulfovibrio sp.]